MSESKVVFKTNYFIAPNGIFDLDLDLKLHEKIVYLYLCRCGNNSTAFPSYNTIAKKCSISRRKAIDVVASLTEKKLLKKYIRKNDYDENQSNIYEVVPLGEYHAPPSAPKSSGSDEYAPNKELGYKEINNNNNIYLISRNEGSLFRYYAHCYRLHFETEHPTMNKEKNDWLINRFEKLSWELDINESTWCDLVDYHFDNLPPNNDGNILSFLADNGGTGCVYRYLDNMAEE